MLGTRSSLEALVESSITFEYLDGGITPVAYPSTTGWRVLPYAVISQCLHGRMELETTHGYRSTVEDGGCMLIPPSIPHCITLQTPATIISRWAHVRFMALSAVDLLARFLTPHVVDREHGDMLGDIAERLVTLHETGKSGCLSTIAQRQTLGFQLLTIMLQSVPTEFADLALFQGMQRILPVLRFVQEHLAGEISRTQLANMLELSPTRFHVVFKHLVGMAPLAYVKQVRITHAQRLLSETEQSVAEVAAASGFPDAFHFSRTFRATCGVSPSQYRHTMQHDRFATRWT